MKKSKNDKFIRVIAPISLLVGTVLDIGALYFLVYSIKLISKNASASTIFIFVMMIIAMTVAVLTTLEIIKHGVVFSDEEMVFTAIDDNNTIKYSEIESIEVQKDEAASFVKNFYDRQSIIIFTLKSDKIITINLGLTTKKALANIVKEICERSSVSVPKIETRPKRKKDKKDKEKSEWFTRFYFLFKFYCQICALK